MSQAEVIAREHGRPAERLRIAHVVHAIAPESGGPSVTVPTLCDELGALGHDVHLHVTNHGGLPDHLPGHCELHAYAPLPGGGKLGVSPAMHCALRREARQVDVMHSHGLWLWTNLDVHWATRGAPCKVVLSPRGMLEPQALEVKAHGKRLLWHLAQGPVARAAHCVHVTSETEYESVRAIGLESPVAVIPNGVAIPAGAQPRRTGERRRLLFLGRIDPIKGIDFLLTAWSRVADSFPDWELRIVGPASGDYGHAMQTMAGRLGAPRVTFGGAAFGAARDDEMHSADLFVLPTRSENFGMAVAEALAAGLPVICSKGAPWSGIDRERCGAWIDVGAEQLTACLRAMLALPRTDLAAMGARGKAWMERDFAWPAQAAKMAETYHWLQRGGAPPAHIRTYR